MVMPLMIPYTLDPRPGYDIAPILKDSFMCRLVFIFSGLRADFLLLEISAGGFGVNDI